MQPLTCKMDLRFLFGVSRRSQPPRSHKRCAKKGATQHKHTRDTKHGHRQLQSCIHLWKKNDNGVKPGRLDIFFFLNCDCIAPSP